MTPKTIAAIAVGAIILISVISVIGFISDPFGWRRHELHVAQARAVHAEQQTQLAQATTRVIEHTVTRQIVITRQAEEAVHVVQTAPGADAPIPPAVRAAWRDGINRLREPAPAADDQHPGDAPGTMPPA